MPSDLQHLQRYATTGDAHAFRELVQAHGAMVHATALRVTRDAAAAQDVAQETFLELARKASGITQSVAAWLHRVAWRRASNAVRDEATRRHYEEAAADTLRAGSEATWEELELLIDEALEELPDNLRAPLVEHFLEGRTQQEVAARLGVSQSTVSRALDSGLAELRSRLRSKGALCGAGLAVLLTANAAQAAPATLAAALGKLAMSGIGASATTTAAGSASVGKATLAWLLHPATVPVVLLLGAGAFEWMQSGETPAAPVAKALPAIEPAPMPAVKPAPQQWDGKILCQSCCAPLTQTRFGILLRDENGQQVIYHLRGAVPRLHETYCPRGQPGAARVTGTPGDEAGLKIFKLERIQPLP